MNGGPGFLRRAISLECAECLASSASSKHAWTLGGAFASFEENRKGSIAVGKLADFVVLSDDPTGVAPDAIRKIQVEMTVIDGKVVFESRQ